MMIVRYGDDGGVDPRADLVEQLPVVGKELGKGCVDVSIPIGPFGVSQAALQSALRRIADGHQVLVQRGAHVRAALPADSNSGDVQLFVGGIARRRRLGLAVNHPRGDDR